MRELPWYIEDTGTTRPYSGQLSIQEIKKQVSMIDLLSSLDAGHLTYISKAREAGWTSIRCPFHEDKRPSASINISIERFKCHQCDVGGDIIDVVKQVKGMETGEAIEWIKNVFRL